MTAAVTAGVMHALAKDHGGLAASPRVTACIASIITFTIATCTAASFGLLLAPLGKLMLQWIHLPPQERKTRAARTLCCDALRDATPLTCARADAIH
eukprot:4017024-Pleurochrysis_carterae.AAC.1